MTPNPLSLAAHRPPSTYPIRAVERVMKAGAIETIVGVLIVASAVAYSRLINGWMLAAILFDGAFHATLIALILLGVRSHYLLRTLADPRVRAEFAQRPADIRPILEKAFVSILIPGLLVASASAIAAVVADSYFKTIRFAVVGSDYVLRNALITAILSGSVVLYFGAGMARVLVGICRDNEPDPQVAERMIDSSLLCLFVAAVLLNYGVRELTVEDGWWPVVPCVVAIAIWRFVALLVRAEDAYVRLVTTGTESTGA